MMKRTLEKMRREPPPETSKASTDSWSPHLWVVIVPFAAIAIAYVLWFALMALLSLPDWLARLMR
jgi:hypothetical protein